MKPLISIAIFFYFISPVFSQDYYIRGETRDEAGNILQNVKILQQTTGLIFRSGSYGTFGITTKNKPDTFLFSLDGFRSERVVVNSEEYVKVQLKIAPTTNINVKKDKLSSLTKDLSREVQRKWFTADETYTSLLENQFVKADKFPLTGISLNIDRASYSNIRRFISQGALVPPDAVRIEEMLNYFNLGYRQPDADKIFHIKSTLTSCPWNNDNQLFLVNLSAQKINTDLLPPTHLVFLIDVSGSMEITNRLPLLKSAFRLLVNNLREQDTVSIVVYGGALGIMLQPTSGNEKAKIIKAIDELAAGGSTPGEAGIRTAYGLAKHHFIKDGNNRVILATDGDFNVGLKTEDELDQLISQHRESGIYLTCLGVGMGNLKDSKIHTLATKGNGNYAYIDSYTEAEKVLLKEFTQTLYTVADKVFMNVNFNAEFVKEYRLVGFDNKAGEIADSLTNIEGGEIGSGFSMTAVFEIIPTEKNNSAIQTGLASGNLADLNVEYSLPADTIRRLFPYGCDFRFSRFKEIDKCQRFSAAVAMFGSKLRASPFTKNVEWNDIISMANSSADANDIQQKEFVSIVEKAKGLYIKSKKKKKRSKKEEGE
ncbi:MAG: VWA domain-containing protein [Bacteroidetes bacterium]|nr:MAG: VWA domain-containing protein [Bacteroidota bacterium]